MASNNSKPNLSTAVSQQVNSSQSNNTPKEKPAIPKSNKIKHGKKVHKFTSESYICCKCIK